MDGAVFLVMLAVFWGKVAWIACDRITEVWKK